MAAGITAGIDSSSSSFSPISATRGVSKPISIPNLCPTNAGDSPDQGASLGSFPDVVAARTLALPLAIRTSSFPKIIQTAGISTTIPRPGKRGLTPDISRAIGFPRFQQLSTAVAEEPSTDEDLIRLLEGEIDGAETPEVLRASSSNF
ncbi:hypothetical protein LINPERHAP2_LOCUS34215 [Linum perenne]